MRAAPPWFPKSRGKAPREGDEHELFSRFQMRGCPRCAGLGALLERLPLDTRAASTAIRNQAQPQQFIISK